MKALQSEGDLIRQFQTELARASKFSFGMALVTKSGLDLILSSIEHCLESGGRGKVLFGVDLPTEPDAIQILCEIETKYKRTFELRRFQPGKKFFHPKLSIFSGKTGEETAIVGSSNLTEGGLSLNHETNLVIDDRSVVRQLIDYFDEHFEGAHAKAVDHFWLSQCRDLWAKRKKAEKRQRQLRDVARTLGKPPADIPSRLRGHVFAFTGGIADWPRDHKLYPYVTKHGGHVAKSAGSMAGAECLVHAEILGGRKTTKKLVRARERNIPIITEEQFFKLAGIRQRVRKD
jgi:HKD family nuclease